MRELFPPEEMDERLRFTQFFMDNFVIHKKSTKSFMHPFTTDLLFKIYKKINPETKLSEADLELYFIMLGATQSTGSIFLDLRAQEIKEITPSLWSCIESLVSIDKYRQLDAKGVLRKTLNPEDNCAIKFIDLFMRNRGINVKTSSAQVFSLYSLYCIQNNLPAKSRKGFSSMIIKYFGPIKKGYLDGKSGITYIHCEIPPEALWSLSLKHGLGVFSYLGKYFDNQGKRLTFDVDGNPDQLTQAHILYRLTGGKHEQTATEEGSAEQEEKADGDVDGREEESPIAYVSGGKEESDAETRDDADEGSYSGTEESQHDYGTNSETAGSESTGSESTDDGFDDDDSRDAEYEGIDDEPDLDNQEKPTLKEVFTALEIAYKINPGTFNKKAMNSYLVSMDVDYGAEDIWDEFMKFIG
ncbi:MAG: hypothetical protein GX985_08365, partial [Gallicola sp.]|nr:hypothetical protein [Gallicola sp.]